MGGKALLAKTLLINNRNVLVELGSPCCGAELQPSPKPRELFTMSSASCLSAKLGKAKLGKAKLGKAKLRICPRCAGEQERFPLGWGQVLDPVSQKPGPCNRCLAPRGVF